MPTMIHSVFGLDTAWRRKGILIAAVTAAALGAGVLSIAATEHRGSTAAESASASATATDSAVAWDRAHRAEFVELKSQGDALAIAGKLQPAYDTYQQCLMRLSDHELTDPVVMATLKSAQENQSRLMAQMLVADGSHSPAASPARENQSAPIALASAEQPSARAEQYNDPFITNPPRNNPSSNNPSSNNPPSNNPPRNNPPAQPDSASGVPNDRGSGKLFGAPSLPGTGQSGGSDLGDGRVPSDLQPNSNLPDLFQPYSGSEPGTPPTPEVIVRRTPSPAASEPASKGSGNQSVSVTILGPQPAPVTGNVDGHPFSLGGPGEPSTETFTDLPAGPLPFTLQGRQYTYYGGTDYVPLAGESTPGQSGGGSSTKKVPIALPPSLTSQPPGPPKKAPTKKTSV